MKILIAGSGPSAYAALLKLTTIPNIEITVLDNSSRFNDNFNDCIFEKNFDTGNRIPRDLNIYDKSNLKSKELGPYSSKIFGGYSNVWGGTAFPPSNIEKSIYDELEINILKYFDIIKENISFFSNSNSTQSFININLTNREKKILDNLNNENIKSYNSLICINENNPYLNNKNEICSNCKSFKWSCKNDTIWSTKNSINKLIEKEKISYINNAKLVSFNENSDAMVSCLIKKSNEFYEEEFDKIFLACGPINTSKIVMNSTKINKLKIKTCDMLSIPYLIPSFGKVKKHSFADVFSYFKDDNFEIFIQIYGFSKSLLKLASNVLPLTNLVSYFPSNLLSVFGGMFVYLDQDHSSKIIVTKENKNLIISFEEAINNNEGIYKKLNKTLRGGGVYPIHLLSKKFDFGKSNHYGAQFAHSKKSTEISSDRTGRILDLKNTHIIDSSVLPRVNVGPVTLTTMANSYRIVEEIFDI